ncbi:flagellar biosynthesis anti-sigma factor FlgM [Alicyclobacillus mali (ex Roth et al. 2021)]|uniref:flagellar biosynthesis anti-sigma factor FlgM n=1 Tax=Alicyclobacillus mali (ex Roth et al. 2021) TaxID=1123961 RepID=UPI001A8F19AF|nr:flagellar biosynthesis anti-sigma factor FlgM [Alicyclobacillus mali (ex Roth et al. 2021)]
MWIPPNSHLDSPSASNGVTSNTTSDKSRLEKLHQLQQAVQNGAYQVNLKQIAEAMVERGVLNGDG